MGEGSGRLLAVVSSGLGSTTAAVACYLVGNADAVTLAMLRWDIGFRCVLPAALASGLAAAPPGAWRGELIMTGAVCAWPSTTSGPGPSSGARVRLASSRSAWGAGRSCASSSPSRAGVPRSSPPSWRLRQPAGTIAP